MSTNGTTLNYQYYLIDDSYKRSSNLIKYWDQMQDFYEGKQFPDGFLNEIPKFTANLCKYLVNTKASKLRGTPYTLAFQSANSKATKKLEKFDKFVLLDIKYDTSLQESIMNMLIYGTEVSFWYFDQSSVSIEAVYKGRLCREHIDLRHFAVANPYLPSTQKQKWVMYWSYEEVEAVRDRCKKMEGESSEGFEKRKLAILPDDFTPEKYPDPSNVAHGLCLVFTRYFRKNGEVVYQSSTKNVDLFDPTSLNPHTNAKKLAKELNESLKKNQKENEDLNKVVDYDIDPERLLLEGEKEEMSQEEYIEELSKFSAYPFEDYTPNRRFNHYYGISDIQDVISAQQAINYCLTMATKNIQDNAWGKWIAKAGALRGQKINNDGGQLLLDYSKGSGWGVQRVEANNGNMINIVEYVNQMISIIRSLSGANEVITGENASNLSGYAISLLQEQGNTVFENQQHILWDSFAVREAQIRLLFYMNCYEDKIHFLYEKSDVELDADRETIKERMNRDIENYRADPQNFPRPNYDNYPEPERITEEEFSSSEIRENRYYIVPKAGRGIKYSEVVQADQINQLFKDGAIAKFSTYQLRAYIELNPLIDETTKAKFKEILDNQEKSENARLINMNKQLQSSLEQQNYVIENLQNQIKLYAQYVKDLRTQFSQKIDQANKINTYQRNAIDSIMKQQQSGESSQTQTVENSPETQAMLNEGLNAAIGS